MESVTLGNLLYIDTESDPDTKALESVQWRFHGRSDVITEFTADTWQVLAELWNESSGVVMWNAPYDLGALSGGFGDLNTWEWVPGKPIGNYWHLSIFGNEYKVKRLGGHRNLIKPFNRSRSPSGIPYAQKGKRKAKGIKSTPVIDGLKLWSILVDDGRTGLSRDLKSIAERELGIKTIPWSREAGETLEYRLQDVDILESVFHVFLQKISNIGDLADYTPEQWCFIKSPATFVKNAYESAYPELRAIRARNDARDSESGLKNALETAYHGGITLSLVRGTVENTSWFDLKGAYASVISFLNTDKWIEYEWEPVNPSDADIHNRDIPLLCEVRSTAVISSINKSLKIFSTKKPHKSWYWNFDIAALKLLFPESRWEVLRVFKPVPMNDVDSSLPEAWNRLKDEEKRQNGRTTLYDYYKFLSNTSYGIKAQRVPFTTNHTNLVIAGIITSRVHLSLIEMVDECIRMGMKWLYSDTDSVCMSGAVPDDAEERINARIAPMVAECEGVGFTSQILSLKRYTSLGGRYLSGEPAPDKVRLHGKGRYKIGQSTILDGLSGNIGNEPLYIAQLAANTELTMTQLKNAFPPCERHVHPFAFHTNIPTERKLKEWFFGWFAHLDTKTTYPIGATASEEYSRGFWEFESYLKAARFFGSKLDESGAVEDLAGNVGLWDEEVRYLFDYQNRDAPNMGETVGIPP